jgi:hypothetical protein
MKGCGKTTLLTLLSKLCRKPLRSGSTTPSVLFRVIELLHPTFLLDESEKFLEIGSEFHALAPRLRPSMERLRRGCTVGLVRMPGRAPVMTTILLSRLISIGAHARWAKTRSC